jgi:hypothetical protein
VAEAPVEAPTIEPPAAEAVPEAAVERDETLPSEPGPERELETVTAGNGGEAEPEPGPQSRRAPAVVPEGVDLHAVTEKPASPRRGWWTRLIQ